MQSPVEITLTLNAELATGATTALRQRAARLEHLADVAMQRRSSHASPEENGKHAREAHAFRTEAASMHALADMLVHRVAQALNAAELRTTGVLEPAPHHT